MARIRTIKPEFFTSEDIVSLSPLARLLYVALWCEADKEGRMVWKPATFKLRYLPGDAVGIDALCSELLDAGLVVLYGDGYAHIPTFGAHQHVNPREQQSQLPVPDASTTRQPRVGTRQPRVRNASSTSRQRVENASTAGGDASSTGDDACPTRREEGKGREGKGRNTPPTPRGSRVHEFPPGFPEFWAAYPRKVGKDAAAKAFAKRKVDTVLLAQMLSALERQRPNLDHREDGRFIPHPSTWLNDGRWQDETDAPDEDWRNAKVAL